MDRQQRHCRRRSQEGSEHEEQRHRRKNVGKRRKDRGAKSKRADIAFNFSGFLHTWDKVAFAVVLVAKLAILRCPLASIVAGTLAKSRRTL